MSICINTTTCINNNYYIICTLQIDGVFSVPGVGNVVGGRLHSGSVREGDWLMLGPYDDGGYRRVRVRTVHRHRLPCRLIQAGQASTVALHDVDREELRKVRLCY